MREKDDGGGRPQVIPETIAPETEAEKFDEKLNFQEDFKTQDTDLPSLKWANPFALPATWSLVLLVLGFMSLWVLSQIVSFSRDLMTWPLALQVPALILITLLLAYIVFHTIRLLQSFKKLRTQRQLSLSDLNELDDRLDLQNTNLQHYRKQISSVLKAYDFEDSSTKNKLSELGFSDQKFSKLEQSQKRLLEGEWPDTQSWLDFYQKDFQTVIDQIAHERIKKTAFRIGLASASCPQQTLDVLIVLGGSLQLNADLCMIYRLKLGRVGLMSLLIRSFRNCFIAMNLEDVSDHLMDQWTDQWKDHASGLAAYLGKIIGTRLAEGGANALLMYRLGQATKKQLQPLRN